MTKLPTEPLGDKCADVHMQWGVQIPMRDGINLSATVYLPRRHCAPAPVVFTLTPYIAQTYHDRGVYFAAHGFPFLTVDVRGRGNSEGEFVPHANEAHDGRDVVEWIAEQPFCNGKVAMWGGSYAGYDQWATAKERPPHLATIVPVAAPYVTVDFPIRNNIGWPYWMQWLTLVSGHTAQDRIFADQSFWVARFRRWFESGTPFRALDSFLGNPSKIFQEWVAHPTQDAAWDAYNPTAFEYSNIDIPVLTITGIYDADQPGALMHYRQHLANAGRGAEHYLVIGPWDHAGTRSPQAECVGLKFGPASLLDMSTLHLEWYAWTMQSGPKPQFLRNKVAYYVTGAEKWRYAVSLEAITARSQSLFLDSKANPTDVFASGLLTGAPPLNGEPDSYVHDPRDVSLAALESTVDVESRVDQRMIHASIGRQLIYHTTPFEVDTEISGFFRLTAWLSIDQPDTDFRVAVHEIDQTGASVLLTSDSMRARYRESLREERLIRTHEPLQYDFDSFMFVSRVIRKGSRLRLVIGPLHSIYSQKNYNGGGVVADESVADARVVTVKLHHDEQHRSVLCVPYGHDEI